MFLKILYFLTVALEFVTVPVFLKHYWPQKCVKSFTYKMLSATLFVLSGFFAIKISGNTTPYAKYIMISLILGWIGDAFLHVLSEKMSYFAVGVIAFLVGHITYAKAFYEAFKTTYPDSGVFAWYEYLFVFGISGLVIGIIFGKNLLPKEKKPLAAALCVYMVVILTMICKAFKYVIGEIVYGVNDNMIMVAITIGIGAILFGLSDGSLGIILGFDKKDRSWRIFNIVTYFAAQILLAASIFFVRSFEILG